MNLVFATWLKGLRYGSDIYEAIDKDAYYSKYRLVIDAILARPNVKIRVCCLKDDPDSILGYAILEGNTCHYAFTKPVWRKNGIMSALLPKPLDTVTHITAMGIDILRNKYPQTKFDPFL